MSHWRAISNETPIIHIRPTDCSTLQPFYCRQAGLSSLHRQSLEQPERIDIISKLQKKVHRPIVSASEAVHLVLDQWGGGVNAAYSQMVFSRVSESAAWAELWKVEMGIEPNSNRTEAVRVLFPSLVTSATVHGCRELISSHPANGKTLRLMLLLLMRVRSTNAGFGRNWGLTLWRPLLHPVPHRVKPSFIIIDIRALYAQDWAS